MIDLLDKVLLLVAKHTLFVRPIVHQQINHWGKCNFFVAISDELLIFFVKLTSTKEYLFSKYFSLFVSQSVMLQKTNLSIFYKVFMILYCLIITNSLTFPCYMITKHPHYNLLCPLVPQWFLCSSTYECFLLIFIWLFLPRIFWCWGNCGGSYVLFLPLASSGWI